MVQLQLYTLEHLTGSGFGRPFPRHGLQLLFWFANCCVTCQPINCVLIMKLVSDCQPERGLYGFHLFGNIEELLPVLDRRSKSNKRQIAYFEVGNLNTETYPAAANLPTYVRENYRLAGNWGNDNIDRIIISCHVRTRVVEKVYVTKHHRAAIGRFSRDKTYEIGPELIRALQSPQLDLTTFLAQTGYYGDTQVAQPDDVEEIYYPAPSAQQTFNIVQTYRRSATRAEQSYNLRISSGAFNQDLRVHVEPFRDNQRVHYTVNVTSHDGRRVQHEYRTTKPIRSPRDLKQSYWPSEWEQLYLHEGCDKEAKKRSAGGGVSFLKILLGAGALCLAARCFSWLRSWWKVENVLEVPWRTPSYRHAHVMLDYVF